MDAPVRAVGITSLRMSRACGSFSRSAIGKASVSPDFLRLGSRTDSHNAVRDGSFLAHSRHFCLPAHPALRLFEPLVKCARSQRCDDGRLKGTSFASDLIVPVDLLQVSFDFVCE